MPRFSVLGVSDERDFCQCCGRTGLKRVVFIRDDDTGQIQHFGTSCANAPAKGFGVAHEVNQAIAAWTLAKRAQALLASREYRRLGGGYLAPTEPGIFRVSDPELMRECLDKFPAVDRDGNPSKTFLTAV